MIKMSQRGATLSQVPNGARMLPGGKAVLSKGPCDFFVGIGRPALLCVLDAKESGRLTSFAANPSHFAEHQRLELIRHGSAGAIAGLLVLNTRTDRLYWIRWQDFLPRRDFYPWDDAALRYVGDANATIDWRRIVEASK